MNLSGTVEIPVAWLLLLGIALVIVGLVTLTALYGTPKSTRPTTLYELRITTNTPWPGQVAKSWGAGIFYDRDLAISMGIRWVAADSKLSPYLHYIYVLEQGGEYDPREYAPAYYWEDKPEPS